MKWEIYYDDETMVSDLDIAWEQAPGHGVLFVLEYLPTGNKMVHMGSDYYYKRGETIISMNLKDLHEHIVLGFAPNAVKFGRWTTNDVWDRVYNRIFPSG